MTIVLLTLVGLWLLVIVPWSVWDARRPYVPGPAPRPVGRVDEVVVRHVHAVEHTHTVRHVHEMRGIADTSPVAPRVVEGTVLRARELQR